jgi:hypothetical protein
MPLAESGLVGNGTPGSGDAVAAGSTFARLSVVTVFSFMLSIGNLFLQIRLIRYVGLDVLLNARAKGDPREV